MAAPEVYSLAQGPITAHAFNKNRSREYRFCCCGREIESPMLNFVIRGRGQLEFERCTDILQGWERLEGYGDPIRGSCHPIPHGALQRVAISDNPIARQIDHVHRLGTELKQDRHRVSRSERLRMVSDPRPPDRSVGMEADVGAAEYQSRRHFRSLESARKQVCCCKWS